MNHSQAVEITFENAQQALIDNSLENIVVVEFYSAQDPNAAVLSQTLSALAASNPEQFIYARLNMDELAPLAGQLGVARAPAVMVLKEGRPADGLGDIQDMAAVEEMVARHLPSPEDGLIKQAQQALADGDNAAALQAASQAHELAPERNDIKFVLIQAALNNKQADLAERLLDSLPLEEQQADYHALRSQLELLQAAAESPELKALEQALQANPEDNDTKLNLAIQYSQAGKNEEALELLFSMLQKDLECLDGQVKKHFLDMLVTLNGEAIASAYRRKYYSLLY